MCSETYLGAILLSQGERQSNEIIAALKLELEKQKTVRNARDKY
jgi:hypothetical protein